MDQRHDEKPIRTGADTHPFIGNRGIAGTHGIDGNHLGVALLKRCQAGFDRVGIMILGHAQDQQIFRAFPIRFAKFPEGTANGVKPASGHIDGTKAAMRGEIGRAELRRPKTCQRLGLVAPGEEGQALRVCFTHLLQRIRGDFHRLIPGNLGIFARTARPHPLQRCLQARGAILRHDAGAALAAEHALIHRMIGIAFNIANAAILQMNANAAATGAHIAGGGLHLIADRRRIGDPIRCAAIWHTPILHFSGEE